MVMETEQLLETTDSSEGELKDELAKASDTDETLEEFDPSVFEDLESNDL